MRSLGLIGLSFLAVVLPHPATAGTAAATADTAAAAAATSAAASPSAARSDAHALGDLSKVGQVDFPTSCKPEVQSEFLRGVALLHSFFYGEARRIFIEVAEKDPSCAMAHWGEAMTWFHPIWAAPSPDDMKAGLAAVAKAEAAEAPTARERAYIESIAAYNRAAPGTDSGPVVLTCHGPTVPESRRAVYREALRKLHEKYPDDDEAAAFYALSLIKSNPLAEDLPVQLEAAGILEPLWRKHPDHPGVVHYLIHAYDYPTLAKKGLAAADHYAQIAPWVPHALHMPSHIYTRLGMWAESIKSNEDSAAASRAYSAAHHQGSTYYEELHALDYIAYARLQRCEDGKVKASVDQVNAITRTYSENDVAVAYAVSAIPLRYALERHAWKEAAALRASDLAVRTPFAAAFVEFAHALGQVRSGALDACRESLGRMQARRDETSDPRFAFFRRQIEIQMLAIKGLIAQAEGRTDEAIALVRYAADEDDALGKNPVSPGSLYPIREILGELMQDLNRPADAQAAFERSLELNPGRFNALLGAGRAAETAGRQEAARDYYGKLLDLAKAGDGTRPELARVRTYLKGDVARTE
jgi:tetratricopeptide (TPR) repeat protein